MDLRLLPTFVAVAECRHFGRAAALVNLSQPAVSHQISQLEESMGARLFNRDGRRVTLTVAGEALLEEARAILDAASRAEARLREVVSGTVGRVRLGMSATAALYLLPGALARYRADHGRFDCRLFIAGASELEDSVVRNELDMAVIAGSKPQGELRGVALRPDPFVLVGPPGAFAEGRARRATLASSDWVLREESSDARRQTLRWLERAKIAPRRTLTVHGPAAVVEAAASGLGLALVSAMAAAAGADRVSVGRAGPAMPSRAFWLVDHPHKHHGAACSAMIALLTSSFADRPAE